MSIFTWITTNWQSIVALITGGAALIHSFQTRTQVKANTQAIKNHITNTDLHS